MQKEKAPSDEPVQGSRRTRQGCPSWAWLTGMVHAGTALSRWKSCAVGYPRASFRARSAITELGSIVYSDDFSSYRGLGAEQTHGVIDHAAKYVDGRVHANGLGNFGSLLKRAIKGTYVSVEPLHFVPLPRRTIVPLQTIVKDPMPYASGSGSGHLSIVVSRMPALTGSELPQTC